MDQPDRPDRWAELGERLEELNDQLREDLLKYSVEAELIDQDLADQLRDLWTYMMKQPYAKISEWKAEQEQTKPPG